MSLPLPQSREDIEAVQRSRKRIALERALAAPFYRGRLEHVDPVKLDDPLEWRKIPILEKSALRALSAEAFYRDFCRAPRDQIAEFWRSGGTTGKPLFYPRTADDIRYAMVGFRRTFECMGFGREDVAHLSFPLGIHPAGQMWARAAEEVGIGVAWVGSGAAAPSLLQLELIQMLRPTIWMGMNSYGLHLANLAESRGVDLADASVGKICCTAEPLSEAKREKLERAWAAKVYDGFGMTECTMMAAEAGVSGELHIWTDLAFIEVLDPDTLEPVPEGRPGTLVMTPLFTNHCTPFLRWNSGDIVVYREEGRADTPFSVFPVIEHTQRTAGFFVIRGINIGHAEFEDFMFRHPLVNDFKAEADHRDGLDVLEVSIELKRTAAPESVVDQLAENIKNTFEVRAKIVLLEAGTLAREFESSVKAPRFVDRRA